MDSHAVMAEEIVRLKGEVKKLREALETEKESRRKVEAHLLWGRNILSGLLYEPQGGAAQAECLAAARLWLPAWVDLNAALSAEKPVESADLDLQQMIDLADEAALLTPEGLVLLESQKRILGKLSDVITMRGGVPIFIRGAAEQADAVGYLLDWREELARGTLAGKKGAGK